MFVAISRTFKEGLKNFVRNGWLSVASISILIFSLYVATVLFMTTMAANQIIENIQSKVNITVYFKTGVSEERIQEIQKQVEKFEEIKSVEYISKEKALEEFKANNADEPAIMQSLEEIGENPLLSSLVVNANDANDYDYIARFIEEESDFKDDISRVNYGRNREVIEKLNSIINQVEKFGLIIVGIFFGIAILITFNTVRITIYARKEEVEVMRLVGASNIFIRLPFIFEGIIYGLIAALVSTGLMYGTLEGLNFYVPGSAFIEELKGYFFSDFWILLGLQAALGILLGIVSSFIAIRRYLKI